VKVVHVDELPEGWLGKPYALKRGVEVADGEYFLFTDGDVRFSKNAIRKAVALCEDRGYDQLGMAPDLWSTNFMLNILLVTFVRTYGLGARTWALDNPKLEPFTGVGAFNLVGRSAYEKSEGFEWLKLDFGDDVALARLIKRSGGKTWVANGVRELDVDWYGSVREMVAGLERVSYSTIGNYSALRTIIIGLAVFLFEFLPFICLIFVAGTWLQWVCVFMIILGLINAIGMSRFWNGPALPALLYPIGSAMLIYIIVRGGILGGLRGGVYWRGTFYSREMLMKGRRIGLP
jgi:glycosyltransferase involved in cell wall biosynthesis